MHKIILFLILGIFISVTGSAQIKSQPVRYGLSMPAYHRSAEFKKLSKEEKYAIVDKHARSADGYDDKLSDLVDYLIRPFKGDEELKARAIFTWMVFNLNYDSFKANNILGDTPSGKSRSLNSGNIFKTRIGVCGDFADLFVKMAHHANLKAKRIVGVAGENLTRYNLSSAAHAWNAVRINKKWYLLDATWAMQGDIFIFQDMTKVRDYKRAVRDRRRNTEKITVSSDRWLDETWFLTPPEIMIKTHFPHEVKWQLLDKPVSSKDVFKANEKRRKRKSNNIQPIKLKQTE